MVEPSKKVSKSSKLKKKGSKNHEPKKADPNLSLSYDEGNQILELTFKEKKFAFDLKNQYILKEVVNNVKLSTILNNVDYLKEVLTNRENSLFPEITKITHHQHYTALECYFDHLALVLKTREAKSDTEMKIENPEYNDIDKCCMCLCDLYDGVLSYDVDKILEQMKIGSDDDVVKLDICQGHYFHKSCLLSYIKDQEYIKCPICYVIYGEMIGDQPDGKMTTYLDKNLHCDGYPEVGTIIIDYSMKSGTRGDLSYAGTNRHAYIPNTDEGKEVVDLLKLAFKRKLIFTIGDSITTGRKNVIVWNGVHQKTNPYGGICAREPRLIHKTIIIITGSANYGWPDPTYFSRVKLELAAKGVYKVD